MNDLTVILEGDVWHLTRTQPVGPNAGFALQSLDETPLGDSETESAWAAAEWNTLKPNERYAGYFTMHCGGHGEVEFIPNSAFVDSLPLRVTYDSELWEFESVTARLKLLGEVWHLIEKAETAEGL